MNLSRSEGAQIVVGSAGEDARPLELGQIGLHGAQAGGEFIEIELPLMRRRVRRWVRPLDPPCGGGLAHVRNAATAS